MTYIERVYAAPVSAVKAVLHALQRGNYLGGNIAAVFGEHKLELVKGRRFLVCLVVERYINTESDVIIVLRGKRYQYRFRSIYAVFAVRPQVERKSPVGIACAVIRKYLIAAIRYNALTHLAHVFGKPGDVYGYILVRPPAIRELDIRNGGGRRLCYRELP